MLQRSTEQTEHTLQIKAVGHQASGAAMTTTEFEKLNRTNACSPLRHDDGRSVIQCPALMSAL